MHGRRTTTTLVAAAVMAAPLLTATTADAARGRADLVTTSVARPPASVGPGGTFGVDAVVANRGRGDAGPSKVAFFLSKDRTRGAGDLRGPAVAVKPVAAGSSRSVSAKVAVPGKARGAYWVIACADATTSVPEAKEGNNCRTSPSRVEVGADLHATLSGTLDFLQEGSEDDGVWSETWHHTGSASVSFTVDGDPAGDPTFASVGSTYERAGSRTARSESDDCVDERIRDEAGAGELVYEGEPFTDDINGSFTRTDLGGVRVGVVMRADWTETSTQTGRGEFPCDPWSKTTSGRSASVIDIELEETSRSGDEIRYRVTSWLGEGGTTSDWDEVTGELTLDLGGSARVLAKPKPKLRPNLGVVALYRVPAQVRAGGRFGVKVTVANEGTARARASQLSVHLSRDARKSSGDLNVGRTAVGELDPWGISTVPVKIDLPESARGKYYVVACADAARKVREIRETDNCNASTSTVEVVEPIDGLLTGTLDFYSSGSAENGPAHETWERFAQAVITMEVSGRGDEIRIVDDGSTYSWMGEWIQTIPYPDCTTTRREDEEAVASFQPPGEEYSAIGGHGRESGLEGLLLGLVMEYDITGVMTSCGTDPVPYTDHGMYDTGLALEQVGGSGDLLTYEVFNTWTGDGEPDQWDAVQGTLTLTLE